MNMETQENTTPIEDGPVADKEALELKHNASNIQIKGDADKDAAEALRKTNRESRKIAIAPLRTEAQERDRLKKAVLDKIKEKDAFHDEIETLLVDKIQAFVDKVNKKAEEAARKAAKKAQEEAEAEQLKIAEHQEAMGNEKAAEAALKTPPAPTAPVYIPPAKQQKVKGSRVTYGYEIFDKEAFIKGCLKWEGSLNIGMLIEDSKVVGQLARALKENFKGPGVQVTKQG